MCLLYVGDNMPRASRARGHVHVPFSTSAPLGALVLLVASDARLSVCPLPHEQLRNNFKVELRWLPLTESAQKFLVDNVPRAPHANTAEY